MASWIEAGKPYRAVESCPEGIDHGKSYIEGFEPHTREKDEADLEVLQEWQKSVQEGAGDIDYPSGEPAPAEYKIGDLVDLVVAGLQYDAVVVGKKFFPDAVNSEWLYICRCFILTDDGTVTVLKDEKELRLAGNLRPMLQYREGVSDEAIQKFPSVKAVNFSVCPSDAILVQFYVQSEVHGTS